QLVHLDRERQPPGQAGAVDLLDHLAEAQHDRRVTLLHDEEAARQPEQRSGHEKHEQPDAGATKGRRLAAASSPRGQARSTAPTPEQAVQPAIEVAPELVEIGGTVLPVLPRSPGFPVLVATAAASPAGIIEREDRSNAL